MASLPPTIITRPSRRRGARSAASGIFRAIWEVVARVPRGRVATYGQVARMAGCPGGARTVGWAMRALPDGLRVHGKAVPWHRVINAEGGISPRRGTAPGDETVRQARALRREGVAVAGARVVDLTRHLWQGWPPSRRGRGRGVP